MVPSREDMKRAIDTIANTSQGDVAAFVVELGPAWPAIDSGSARLEGRW